MAVGHVLCLLLTLEGLQPEWPCGKSQSQVLLVCVQAAPLIRVFTGNGSVRNKETKRKRTLDKVSQTSNGTSSVMHVWAQRELISVLSERSDTNTAKVTLHAFICCYLQNSSPTWFALNSRIICCGGWIDDANKGTKKKQDKYSETADSEGLADTSVQN